MNTMIFWGRSISLLALIVASGTFAQDNSGGMGTSPAPVEQPGTDSQGSSARTDDDRDEADQDEKNGKDERDEKGEHEHWHHDWHRHWQAQMAPHTRFGAEAGFRFPFPGYAVQLSVKPLPLPGWALSIGLIGSYGFGHDDAFNSGVEVGVRQGYSVTAYRYFRQWGPSGPFVALELGASELSIRSVTTPGAESRPWAFTLTPQFGFQWFPFHRALFIRPWLGGTIQLATHGPTTVADATYNAKIISPSGGINLGFEF